VHKEWKKIKVEYEEGEVKLWSDVKSDSLSLSTAGEGL
jgi:hypothetical protein